MFCCMLLALASQKERKQQLIIHHVLNIILSEFLPSSVHPSCWMQDVESTQNIRLSKVCFDRKHHWIVISSRIFRLGSFSIYFFHFPHLFIHISTFTNPKNDISTIDQGFLIFARSLEALVWFISSSCSFSSLHCPFPLSKSKNTKNNLLILISLPSSLWIQPRLATVLI